MLVQTASASIGSPSAMIPLEHSLTCNERLEKAKEIFLKCAEASKLWNEMKADGNFTIQCDTSGEAKDISGLPHFPGARKLLISEKKKDISKIGTHILSGLISLKPDPLISVVEKKCEMPVEIFVRNMASIEHKSVIKSHEIASACVKEETWPANWDVFRGEFNQEKSIADFDHFLARQEESGSSNLQRSNWHRLCSSISAHMAWYSSLTSRQVSKVDRYVEEL